MKTSIVFQCLVNLFLNICFENDYVTCIGNTAVIKLPQGSVKGMYDWFKQQNIFLGIPYANVTGRFQEPGSPPTWDGIFTADRRDISCNQYSSVLRKPIGQEDCLVLNVFTPSSTKDKPFPVMVFIHGGGFYWGSNTNLIYNPTHFVREEVIVVTINYRLGAFGFLCLGLEDAPGNIGLKDQLAALQWVQDNIAYFGGDPNSVTLFGESAGAVSVHHLVLSPHLAKGLFHRAIMQSGSIMTPQDFSYEPIKCASNVAFSLGYTTSNPNELLNIFRNSTADDIVKASYRDETNNAFAPYFFRPCKETGVPNKTPIITTTPVDILNRSGLNMSVIIGFNDKEGIYWAQHYDIQTLSSLREKFDHIIPSYLVFEKDEDKTNFCDDVVKVYFEDTTITKGLIEYFTDSLIAYPSTFSSEAYYKKPNRTVYNYYFKYDSLRNVNKYLTRLRFTPGACHGDELFYMFEPLPLAVLPTLPKDMAILRTMTQLWTSFAKTGVPSNGNIKWNPSEDQLEFLEIDSVIRNIPLPNESRMEFWRNAFEKYGRVVTSIYMI